LQVYDSLLNIVSSKLPELASLGKDVIYSEWTMKFLVLCLMACLLNQGCSWVGETAGKAQAKIERKVDAMQQGYEDGYKNEKRPK